MRTFLSHDETARWSDCGENEISETLSSGGFVIATSFEMSPVVLFALVALEEAALPKNDMVEVWTKSSRRKVSRTLVLWVYGTVGRHDTFQG